MRSPVVAVVAGHGLFADGMISAVEQITGRGAAFVGISNSNLGPGDIEAALQHALDATGARVICTDLPAGSCTMAARRLLRARKNTVLVTGVNVAVLLELLFAMAAYDAAAAAGEQGAGPADTGAAGADPGAAADASSLATLVEAAAAKARTALVSHGG